MMTENESYIFGLLVTDGSLYLTTRNRGRVTLELKLEDGDIIDKLLETIPNSHSRIRVRDTNFKKGYETRIFSNSRLEFRKSLIFQGFPTTNKILMASPPILAYSEIDFWRGAIDGDGSIGISSRNIPFVSFVTKSDKLKQAYISFIKKHLGLTLNPSRNKRDSIYNIAVFGKSAVTLSKLLYLPQHHLYLSRKYNKAIELQKFKY